MTPQTISRSSTQEDTSQLTSRVYPGKTSPVKTSDSCLHLNSIWLVPAWNSTALHIINLVNKTSSGEAITDQVSKRWWGFLIIFCLSPHSLCYSKIFHPENVSSDDQTANCYRTNKTTGTVSPYILRLLSLPLSPSDFMSTRAGKYGKYFREYWKYLGNAVGSSQAKMKWWTNLKIFDQWLAVVRLQLQSIKPSAGRLLNSRCCWVCQYQDNWNNLLRM